MRVEEALDRTFGTEKSATAVADIFITDDLDGAIALVGGDSERAAAFVQRELGPIEALGGRAGRLLDTLELFLKHGQRVANASAISGRHRDTVHRHLREIEELLGCRIEERSADLLWALRLRAALPQRGTLRGRLTDGSAAGLENPCKLS
jgi:DNA-binding PucR family transcriptional regulator